VLTRLDVVNEMLATLGELPMNSLEEGHPLAPTAIRTLSIANSRIQSMKWWFNRELTDLLPDLDGHIYLPNDTLQVDPQDQGQKYVQRGRRLYKPYEPTLEAKFKFDRKVRCWLLREVPFDDCPPSIQYLVSYAAQLDFMKAYEADAQKYQQVARDYMESLKVANAEHTRAQGVNMLARRPIFNSRTTIGAVGMEADYWPHP